MRFYNQNIWGSFGPHDKIANRNQLLAQLIFEHAPDVCCFQECDPASSRMGEGAITRLLSPVYEETCPAVAARNFTPVFYNRNTLSLIEDGYLLFPGRNNLDSKSASWAILESKEDGKRFAAISTHFWWKYDDDGDNLQREENARCIGQICRDIDAKYHIPIFAMGDLNSGVHLPGRALQELEIQGLRDTRQLAKDSTNEFTWHPCPPLGKDGLYIPGPMPVNSLDYIYVYQHPDVDLLRFQVLTDEKSLASSDHCPLILDFDLK